MSKRLEGGYLGARPSWSLAANPGIWAVEQVYARRVAGTWPVGAGSFDEFYEYVTFLLHANGTNASTSFPDSSLYGRAVTVSGNAQVSTAQSKFGGASAYFDGAGDYLSVASSSAMQFETGDFTIECWVYITNVGGYHGILDGRASASYSNYVFGIYNVSGTLRLDHVNSNGGTRLTASTTSVPLNTWTHIAWVRNGGTISCYVNGTKDATTVSYNAALNPAGGTVYIGSVVDPQYLNGYIDELRITKGYARYTSNFTVPTGPGEDEGAPLADPFYNYVSLLLTMNGSDNSTTFADKSPNALTVTANGDAKISTAQKRYGVSSAYLDGNGDYLSVPASTSLDLGSSDFTIEFWAYCTDQTTSYPTYISTQGGWSSGSFGYRFDNTGQAGKFSIHWNPLGDPFITSTSTFSFNKWRHTALTRSGTTIRLFVDGVLEGTQTVSSGQTLNLAFGGSMRIGWSAWDGAQGYLNDYIDDLRITKGVARYVASFIPPLPHADYGTLVDPYLGSTSLLMPMEGPNNSTGFFDRADRLPVTTYGNAKISNAQYKWGLTSAYFDGSGDYLKTATVSSVAFGTGDFTAEAWVYFTAIGTYNNFIDTRGGAISTTAGWAFGVQSNGTLHFYTNAFIASSSTGVITLNRWYHVAVCRVGTTLSLYADGARVATATHSQDLTNQVLSIGANGDGSEAVTGYIDDLRIVKGVARYTTNFTPPTAAFNSDSTSDPYLSNVSLLLKMDGANNSTTFTDSSLTPKAVLAKGNAKISTTQSKFGGSSAYFDGVSSTYLAMPAVGLPIGTGDFTIEMWANFANPSAYQYFCASSSMTGGYFQMALNGMASNAIGIGRTNVDWPLVFSGHNMVANTWYHIAICRANGVARCFVNGSQIGSSITDSTNFTIGVSEFHIGHQDANGTMTGYLDDFRLTNAARYTANFLPPTISHPVWSQTDASFSSVSLLLNGNGTNASTVIADRSTNGLTLVPNGDAKISTTQSRFGGASLYFDGTGDYLSVAPTSTLVFDSDFTIEGWIYCSSVTSNKGIFASSAERFGLIRITNYIYWLGSADISGSGVTFSANTWVHVAACRSSGTLRLFVNGALAGSGASTQTPASNTWYVGSDQSNEQFDGYIDDLRVTKGVARYTAAFTPPVAPYPIPVTDANFGAVSLLLHMNGANASTYFPDHSYNALTVTANGNAQISTAQSKFGGASAYFDGTGDYLDSTSSASPSGTDSFTIESWIYPTAVTGQDRVIIDTRGGSGFVFFINTSGYLQVFDSAVGSVLAASTALLVANTWQHIALSKSGSTATYYVNGVAAGTYTLTSHATATSCRIGARNDAAAGFIGYIDSLRITKGIARYTAAFTPPTAQFPNS